jgi:hypothetical protein
MRRRRGGLLLLSGLSALAVTAASCGSEDHPNEPRPPSPIEVTARVDDKEVTVAPNSFGAGIANFTISNQSQDTVQLTFDGERLRTESNPIQPNGVGQFKLDLDEGEYQVSGGPESDATPQTLRVGAERASSQNQLLLP